MSFCGCQSTIRSSLQPTSLLSPPVRQPCCSAPSRLHGWDQTQHDTMIMKCDNEMGLFRTNFNHVKASVAAVCICIKMLQCFFFFFTPQLQRTVLLMTVWVFKSKERKEINGFKEGYCSCQPQFVSKCGLELFCSLSQMTYLAFTEKTALMTIRRQG